MTAEEIMMMVAGTLDRAEIPAMLVGAFSASFHGVPRSTEDADFVIHVSDLPLARLAGLLGPEFIIDPQARIETFTLGVYYNIRRRDSDFSIDLFLLNADPHGQASFQRRIAVSYGTERVDLSTAEDVIITKLRWSQGGRRQKDIVDARNVLAVKEGKLDMDYIRRWCSEHGTLRVLEETLKSIPPLPPE